MTRTFDTIIFVLSSAARDEIWSNDADWINSIILPEALSPLVYDVGSSPILQQKFDDAFMAEVCCRMKGSTAISLRLIDRSIFFKEKFAYFVKARLACGVQQSSPALVLIFHKILFATDHT